MKSRAFTLGTDPLAALTARYREAVVADLAELLAACGASDLGTIGRIAHRQAGLAGSFGAEGVGEAAAVIDAQAASGGAIQPQAVDQFVAALHAWLADSRLR